MLESTRSECEELAVTVVPGKVSVDYQVLYSFADSNDQSRKNETQPIREL